MADGCLSWQERQEAQSSQTVSSALPCPKPPLLSPLTGGVPFSLRIQHRVQLDVDSAGWVLREEGCVVLGFACLAHLFCILPDVMFLLLCLF